MHWWTKKDEKENDFEREAVRHIPYHLASSSLATETVLALAGAGFFLENRATVLNVAGLDADGADDLDTALKLSGVPSISETPIDAIFVPQSFKL